MLLADNYIYKSHEDHVQFVVYFKVLLYSVSVFILIYKLKVWNVLAKSECVFTLKPSIASMWVTSGQYCSIQPFFATRNIANFNINIQK